MNKQYQATLVRGSHYALGMRTWKANTTHVISEEDKATLERDAVHVTHTADGESVTRQQFKFVEVPDATPAPAPAVQRTREQPPVPPAGGGGGGDK